MQWKKWNAEFSNAAPDKIHQDNAGKYDLELRESEH
jgi:hypothetical protein